MRKSDDFAYEYLRFDNLNFKLAVLQQLMFEKKVFTPAYDFGNFYEEAYNDDADYGEACEKYAQRARYYFTYLAVPREYAKYITEINVTLDDEIYYEIDPEGTGVDGFQIDRISEREVAQFPKLRRITFSHMPNCVDALKKQLRPLKIKVLTAGADGEKTVSFRTSIALIALTVMILGALGGYIFHKQYAGMEVSEGESVVSEEKHGIFEESEDAVSGSGFDFGEVELPPQEDITETVKRFMEEQRASPNIEKGAEKNK